MDGEETGKSVPASFQQTSAAGAEEPPKTTTTTSFPSVNLQTTKSLVPPISLFLDQHQQQQQSQHQQQGQHHLFQPHFTSAQFLALHHHPNHISQASLPQFPHQQQHYHHQHIQQQQQSYCPSPFSNHHYNHLYPYRENRAPCLKHPHTNLMMDDRSGFGSGGGGGGGGGSGNPGGGGGNNGCNGSVTGLNHAGTSSYRDWDSRWESGTVVTAATSVRSGGSLDMDLNFLSTGKQGNSKSSSETQSMDKITSFQLPCHLYASSIVDIIISVCAFLSPILMLILPKVDPVKFRVSDVCGPELTTCDGILISFFFKILLLVLASVLLFFRSPRANMPRVFLSRAIILGLILFLTVAYWLFFMVQSSERRVADYDLPFRDLLLSYPVPLLECILWVHYLAVILIEIRHQRQEYYVKVVRSPDGHSRSYTIGQLSIQATAVFVLEKYYSEFPIYNPHLDSQPFSGGTSASRKKNKNSATIDASASGLKFYDVDAVHPGMHTNTSTPNNNSHNTSSLTGNGHLPEANNHHHQYQNSHSAGIPPFMPSSSPRSTGLMGGGGSNFHVSPLNGGSNSIYSIRSAATGNNQHNSITSAHMTSGKSHSVVGVERSSDRHHHHNHHHSRKSGGGGSSSRSSHRGGGSSDRDRKATSGVADHHKERMHEESEFERRVKKRRVRLISSAEEAFTHVRLMGESDTANGVAISMDPLETAQAIFPSMSRPLQKYLRVTRQQNRHTLQSIQDHLSTAMKYGLSAKSFLEKYLLTSPVLNDDSEARNHIQSWGLVSDVLLSRSIRPGTTFMLRQGDVSLLVTISALPYFDLQEEVIDPKSNRFVFRMNSETSV